MSVVIVGGNDCMKRIYCDTCKKMGCKAKVFTQMEQGMKSKIGTPDLMILFTNTVSHKMVIAALSEVKGGETRIERSHSSSLSSLKNILKVHLEGMEQ